MSFKCQISQTQLTFNKNVFVQNCDVRLLIILCVMAVIMPTIQCAKLENPQIRLLINDDDLLQEKTNIHEAGARATGAAMQHDNSGEHFNLYRSELKRLSYETIHRILRDENEPSYRREDTELRYYQKRSPSYEQNHQLIKRSTDEKQIELNLSQKNLTEFRITPEFQKLVNLVSVLDLSRNYIAQLNVTLLTKFTALSVLKLQNNSFNYIPLHKETTLRTLNLNNNLIKTSTLSSNIFLRNLYLSHNLIENLSSIQFSLLKNLESLDISHNLLRDSESSFFTQRMHNLKHLNLAFNQLGCIYRETFYNLLSLNTLLLSHNNISDIDYETFLALPNLQYLDLSFNNLQGKSIRALQGITGLVALNIAFNPNIGPYMQEFVASWSLKELDASGTGLCQIPAALAQSVRTLKLTHNWLKVINCGDLDSYPLLQYLDLSFSHIEHIEDDALGRLEILEILMLDHNNLLKIPFSLPVSLEHLFLQNNGIMEIPQQAFQGLNNLKTLDLSHNKLLYLPDIMLPKLQTLNLQSSDIRGISQGIIHSLPKLNDLMLEDNPIKCADLLGIAEWASTCRLRMEREGESGSQQTAVEEEEDNFLLKVKGLKNKFEKMHNFYEQFGWNVSFTNETLLSSLKSPTCEHENINELQNTQKYEKQNIGLNKTFKEINFNQSSTTSRLNLSTTASTDKSFAQHNNQQTNANSKSAVKREQEQQQQQPEKKLQDETAVKTITIENPTQIAAVTMQSSISNENQQTSYTNPKSFNLKATTTTTVSAKTYTKAKTNVTASSEGQKEREIVIKPKLTNEMKTFDHLIANADADADAAKTALTIQQDEIAAIGNSTTKSSSNMTEVVEAISKRTKEAQQQQQQQLKDRQYKTTFTKTFQTTKSKKWLKQEAPLKGGNSDGGEGIGVGKETSNQNKGILLKHRNTKDINAPQFIKSTTFAMPINSEIQATTTVTPPFSTFRTTAAPLVTTTMAESFIHFQQENKHDIVGVSGREGLKEKSFETIASKLEINVKEEKQQHEIERKNATTKEIKSLTTNSSKSMQINISETQPTPTTTTATTSNKRLTKITLKNPPELTTKMMASNKLLTTNTPSNNSATEEKHKIEATTDTNAEIFKTFKTIDNKTTEVDTKSAGIQTTTTTAITTLLAKDKDLASNYKDNYSKGQITKTSNILAAITTTPTSSSSSSSSSIISGNNNKSHIANSLNNTTTTTTVKMFVDQQQSRLLQNMMSHYRQSLQKDVSVKCAQSNSNECISVAITTAATTAQMPDELGRTPTIDTTLEQTTATKTSTEIPEAVAPTTTTTTTDTTTMIHKHEPLQLLVKDRHLIGTPLLMHKGENLMVTADELILPTNNPNTEHESNNSHDNGNSNSNGKSKASNNNNNKKNEHYDLETNTKTNGNKNKYNLELSQTAKLSATTEAAPSNQAKYEQKLNKSANEKSQEDIKVQDTARRGDLGKMKKPNYDTKTKKPSLIMKKMTIVTKQHEETQHFQSAGPLENEVHVKQFDNSRYQELKPLPENLEKEVPQAHMLKHSTVNTPINGNDRQPANLLQEPHTFQHEHELLLQQILQDQQQTETHAKLTKSEQWSDLRKTEAKETHSGLILLVSSGLFVVLLLGLMHVYRCDMPWRRHHPPSHHMRPHQRQNHSMEDDSHSFLSYSEGMQKWHHSTRLEAPYNSPLHNLHVRELQKTSAIEKPATVKSAALCFKPSSLNHSMAFDNTRSLSQSSTTTTTSTASASSSVILDDESFYIEMTPDSGQLARALQSELLPMELLNLSQVQTLDSHDTVGDSQTSMADDESVVQQQRHRPHLNSLNSSVSTSAALPYLNTATTSRTSLSVKPQTQSRKFGLW